MIKVEQGELMETIRFHWRFHSEFHWRFRAFVCVICLGCSGMCSFGQQPVVAPTRLGVDSVKLSSGQRLYGIVLTQNTDGSIDLAVERKWLETTYPQLAADFIQLDEQQTASARTATLERAEAWLSQRAQNQGLAIFVENGIAALKAKIAQPPKQLLFVRIVLKPDQFSDLKLQPQDRRRIVGLAWHKRLDGVTTTPTSMLEKKLEALGVDLATATFDLSQDVSPVAETERQWAARKALVEHQLRMPLEYQGSGPLLVRKSDQPDVGALIGQMLGSGGGLDAIGQLGAELGLPEFKKPAVQYDGWKRVATEAERDGFCGVLVTRMTQNLLSPEVLVELSFYAMEKPGDWFLVHRIESTANANQQPADRLQQIQSDPQIKAVLDTLKGLGLGDQSLVDQAMRHGAATQQALQNGAGLFNQFLLKYTRNIDGPVIPIAAGPK